MVEGRFVARVARPTWCMSHDQSTTAIKCFVAALCAAHLSLHPAPSTLHPA